VSAAAKIRTMAALGPRSLLRVGAYRLLTRAGLHPVQRLKTQPPALPPFFRATAIVGVRPASDTNWRDRTIRFDWLEESLPRDGVPDWFANPLGAHGGLSAAQPWWTIPDFGTGDIKGLWELSRFGWALPLAQAAASGDPEAGVQLNRWIGNWTQANRLYAGANWKCGQEASIRIMHLAAAAIVLGEDHTPLPSLATLVEQHLARIAPTISYALGQNNNHGTSEAAALFIGGSLLANAGNARGFAWTDMGRRWLEDRADRLIATDGSFSQYSVNYHRVMLDTYSLAECWRSRRGAPPFSARLMTRLAAATDWLRTIVDERSGDAPNIGASDGARLLPLTPTGYRDFRPSVQLASALFLNARAYKHGAWDAGAQWLGIDLPETTMRAPISRSFDEGGWHVLRRGTAIATMRYPRFRFRPSQADALHLDLMVDGLNLLRDAGTYSYNDTTVADGDFTGTAFHNSVTFDGQDQMPRLGRFLFGGWLDASDVQTVESSPENVTPAAGYRDARGNRHHRRIQLSETTLTCIDRLDGPFASAVLRWRLPYGDWTLADGTITNGKATIEITHNREMAVQLSLRDDREARNYAQLSKVTLIEAVIGGAGTVETRVRF